METLRFKVPLMTPPKEARRLLGTIAILDKEISEKSVLACDEVERGDLLNSSGALGSIEEAWTKIHFRSAVNYYNLFTRII